MVFGNSDQGTLIVTNSHYSTLASCQGNLDRFIVLPCGAQLNREAGNSRPLHFPTVDNVFGDPNTGFDMNAAEEHYREYTPAPALQPYVACYWTSTAPAASSHRVLPDGCIDILFDLSGDKYPDATVIGTMTRPLLFETSGPVEMVAVRFRPGGAVPFLQLSAHEITDSNAQLTDVWQTDRLAERIRDEADKTRRVRRLEAALLARLGDCGEYDARVQAAISVLEQPGLSVEGVAATVDISRQQLTRLFRRHVGVSPKQFARVLRMQRLRSLVRRLSRPDWPAVALAVGYYDQAHMIAECRALAGATPTELAKR